MKKTVLFMLLLMAIPLAIFGQDVPTEPPDSWGDIIANPGIWFASFAGVSLLTAFLATVINGLLNLTTKFLKQLVAWGVAIALLLAMALANFGYAKDFLWYMAVLHGLAAGLASNGVFDIPVLKAILDKLSELLRPNTT